jgi:histidinol-phosphate phosphatase family protein
MQARPAAFFDRDGTIIDDRGYVSDPSHVSLVPGVASAIRRLNRAGIRVIVVTNQSGIARGMFTRAAYDNVRARVDELLAAKSARVDASYMCPHHPDFTGPCDCRKPGESLFRQAAAEHGLDLTRSLFLGDRWRDVAPAVKLGGMGILVPSPATPPEEIERVLNDGLESVPLVGIAVDRFLATLPARNVGQ